MRASAISSSVTTANTHTHKTPVPSQKCSNRSYQIYVLLRFNTIIWMLTCGYITSKTVTKTPHTHLGCRASGGEAGSAARWGDTGWSRFHNKGSQPTRALWDASVDADERAQRVRGSCSSSGRAHTETDSQPGERETRCCWHYREREREGRTSQPGFISSSQRIRCKCNSVMSVLIWLCVLMCQRGAAQSWIDQPKCQHLNVGHLREDRNLGRQSIRAHLYYYIHACNLN